MDKLMENMQIDDLQGEARELAEVIGMEAFCNLSKAYGGDTVYVAHTDSCIVPVRNRCIQEEYKAGAGVKQLARKYNLSGRRIYGIVNEQQERKKTDG